MVSWAENVYKHVQHTPIQRSGTFELRADDASRIDIVLKAHHNHSFVPIRVSVEELTAMRDAIDDMLTDLENSEEESHFSLFQSYVLNQKYPERLAADPRAKALFKKHTGSEFAHNGCCYVFAEALRRFMGIGTLSAYGYKDPSLPKNWHILGHVVWSVGTYSIDDFGTETTRDKYLRWCGPGTNWGGQVYSFMLFPDMKDEIEDQLLTDESIIHELMSILKGYEDG